MVRPASSLSRGETRMVVGNGSSRDARPDDEHGTERRSLGRPFVDGAAALEIVRAMLRHRTPRRLGVLATYAAMWSAGRGLSLAFQLADELVDPSWREQPVRAPVFIFASPRSGTTLLHRLASYDTEHFVGPLLYETVFPSVALIRAIEALGELDSRLPVHPLRRLVDGLNAVLVGDTWDGFHKLGLDQPEEDEPSFVYAFHTPTAMLMVPHIEEISSRFAFDELPESVREGFLDSYEGVLKRILRAHGGDKRYLNKNVFFTPRVRSMAKRFPDARFVYLVRDPYEAMPSFMNMFTSAWRFHSPELANDPERLQKLAEVGYEYYRRALRLCDELSPDVLHVIRYEDLVADPKKTVEALYEWLGVPVLPAFEARLDEALASQRAYESQRDYTLATFGMTRDEVYDALRPVFERFGYASPQLDSTIENAAE